MIFHSFFGVKNDLCKKVESRSTAAKTGNENLTRWRRFWRQLQCYLTLVVNWKITLEI